MEKKLKQLREKRGLSQAAVAEFIGISRQMYNKYENGEVEPSLKAINLLCKLYNVSYDEMLSSYNKTEHFSYHKQTESNNFSFSSPDAAYGRENILSKILSLLPALLYSEKAKLLSSVAQSMTNDVEAGKIAQNHKTVIENPSYLSFVEGMKKISEITKKEGFSSKGLKWTREEMNER